MTAANAENPGGECLAKIDSVTHYADGSFVLTLKAEPGKEADLRSALVAGWCISRPLPPGTWVVKP